MADKTYQVNISTRTIAKVLLVFLGLVFLYMIKEVVGIVFVAWILASALDPLIDKLQRYKIPRWAGIIGVYLGMLLVVALVFYLLIPPLSEQISAIVSQLPSYVQDVAPGLLTNQGDIINQVEEGLKYLSDNLGNLTSGLYTAVSSVFGTIATTIIVMVITFYMTVEEEGIKRFLKMLAPVKYQPYIIRKINRIQHKMGSWLWGQIILMLTIGVLVGLSMWILGIKYFLVLGLIAALLEVIPIVGPVLAAIPAVFFAFADQPLKALLVIIIYVVIQQVENQILVPKIMNKAVGLNPIIVLITMLVGAKVGGLVGVILAVPTATIISIFLEDFFSDKQKEESKLEQEK